MKDLLDILQAMAAQKDQVPDRLELLLDMGERVVKYASPLFGTKADEVAILVLTADQRHLRFVAPRKFAALGTIPISKRDSIAVTILHRKSGEAMNNVPMVRHVAFFESVKLRDKVQPIQKMVTVPILAGSEAIGVAQISRKGETPAEAGPDFSTADVQKAQALFQAVGPILKFARPDEF